MYELVFSRVGVCVVRDKNQEREREMTIWFMFPFLFLQQNLIFSKFSAPKRVQIFWSWPNKKLSNDKISVLGLQPLSCYEANWNRTWVTQVHRSNHWSKRGVRSNIPHVFEILNVYTNVYAWGHTNVEVWVSILCIHQCIWLCVYLCVCFCAYANVYGCVYPSVHIPMCIPHCIYQCVWLCDYQCICLWVSHFVTCRILPPVIWIVDSSFRQTSFHHTLSRKENLENHFSLSDQNNI